MLLVSVTQALAAPSLPMDVSGVYDLPSPHAGHMAQFGAGAPLPEPPRRGVLPRRSARPDLTVYGYLAYWSADLNTVQWDDITHLAIFSAGATSTGGLTETQRWDQAAAAVAMAAPYGVRVHLCVTNFDPTSLGTLLGSPTSRANLIDELSTWMDTTGAHGINIDFEGVPGANRADMVTFTRDLAAEVGEVVLATPSVDWSNAWDYAALTQDADLFLMGYGYHWSGSSYAGPTDPLLAGSGTVWSGINSYSLTWSVDDYIAAGADPARVILGLPLYGRRFPTASNAVPSASLGKTASVVFEDAWDEEAVHGRNYEPDAQSPYTYDGTDQIWYGDEASVQSRIAYVRDTTALAGIGFWAMHYADDTSFWQMIHDETRSATTTVPTTGPGTTDTGTPPGATGDPAPAPSTEFRADAGLPFLAYVGDRVILSADGSQGPGGVQLQYRWTQIEGPAVALTAAETSNPSFDILTEGNVVFEVEVGDGSAWSEAATSYIVVIDPGAARRHLGGCGCASGAIPSGWIALSLLVAFRRRDVRARRSTWQ